MEFLEQLKNTFSRLSYGQKLGTISVFVLVAAALGLLSVFLKHESFSPLYIRLSQEDAGRVVEQLNSNHVPYRLTDGGTTVNVPASKVFDLRLKLSMNGLPAGGGMGFELFDKNALGLTDFTQQVNYQRAIQGELVRTISELESVQNVKVHLVFPDASAFFENDKDASASVVLGLHPGAVLDKRQVQGIVHLVAGAVKGLRAENVTVVDTQGNLLSNGARPGSLLAAGDQMLAIQHNVEEYLEQKILTMLNRVLGADRAVVRISALLDTQLIKEQSELFDPSGAVRSEQVIADRTAGNSQLKNYELGKTVRQVVASPGNIRRLSVSLVIDGVRKVDPANPSQSSYTPRTPEEIQTISDLVKQAVGFSEDREDKIEVKNIAFDTEQQANSIQQMQEAQKAVKKERLIEQAMALAQRGAIAGAMIFIILSVLKTLKTLPTASPAALPTPVAVPMAALPAATAGVSGALSPPAQQELPRPSTEKVAALPAGSVEPLPKVAIQDLVKATKENPGEVARILQRGWGKS